MLDDRPTSAAREDGAVFAPTRVRSSRRQQVLASIVIVAVAALVAVGVLDRQPEHGDIAVAPVPAAPSATLPTKTARATRPPRPSNGLPGIVTGQPGDQIFAFDVRPAGSHLFIHGDVFSLAVSRVRVTLEDAAGHVAARRAVDLPGGSTAFLIGAVPRFDV